MTPISHLTVTSRAVGAAVLNLVVAAVVELAREVIPAPNAVQLGALRKQETKRKLSTKRNGDARYDELLTELNDDTPADDRVCIMGYNATLAGTGRRWSVPMHGVVRITNPDRSPEDIAKDGTRVHTSCQRQRQ